MLEEIWVEQAWPDTEWNPADKPLVIANGMARPLATIDTPIECSAASVVGINEKTIERLCDMVRAPTLNFYEMRVADLSPLTKFVDLQHLSIRWNTKVTDLSPLAELTQLRTLVLEDVPKVDDLTPLASLRELIGLDFSGGIWNKNRALTLDPIAALPKLLDLHLTNLAVSNDGLRPLAGCKQLRRLRLSNQFPTEDYAYLSVHLPDVECEMFAPYVPLECPIGDNDVMVVGKRRPFLNSKRDIDKMARYAERFQKHQEEFASL